MKLLFHNRPFPELKGCVGAGRELHGFRLTSCRSCVEGSNSWGDRDGQVLLFNKRTFSESSVQIHTDNHLPLIVSKERQGL